MVLRDSEDSARAYSKGMSIPSLELASPTSFDAPEIDGHPMILWSAESVEHGCGIGQCVIAYNITPPYLWKTPLYIKDGESESYNIVANHLKNYSRFVFRQSGPQDFPVDEFYRAVSAALLSWMVHLTMLVQDGQSLLYQIPRQQAKKYQDDGFSYDDFL